ncbi:hypothetical protein DFH06DRAFT_1090136 [Mycena polygramma]|nr:hypothetical protein DFH06DRAFT_1090136 [Mycena polygramma]
MRDIPTTHATRSTAAKTPLKKGRACLNCRCRCDARKPICGPCCKHPKDDECEYSDTVGGGSRTRALEDTVRSLEARLYELEHPEDCTPSVTLFDPYAPYPPPGQVSVSPPHPTASRSLPDRQLLPVLSPSSWSHESRRSTPFGTQKSSDGNLNLEETINDALLATPLASPHWYDTNRTSCPSRLQAFRPQAFEFGFFLDWDRFLRSLQPISPGANQSSALLNAIYMWGAHFASDALRELGFRQKALQCAAVELTQDALTSFLHTIQAEVLLSHFFFDAGRFLEARAHAATAAGLVVGAGLHQIRSLNHPAIPVIGITAADGEELRLPPPADALEEGERINGFWTVFVLQRNLSIALEPYNRVGDVLETGGDIDTPWPMELSDYDQGRLASDFRGSSTVHDYLSGLSSCWQERSPSDSIFALHVKACILLHRAVHMHRQWRPDLPAPEAQSWLTAFGVVERLICTLRSQLPDIEGLQGHRSVPNMLLTHSLLDAATIRLHGPFYGRSPSTENCLAAAHHMFRFDRPSLRAIGDLNPMMATLWMTAWSVFADEVRRIRREDSAPWPPQLACGEEDEKAMIASLQNGLNTLSVFAGKSLLMRKFSAVQWG